MKVLKSHILFILTVSQMLLHGCITVPVLQSGRTLGKDNTEIGIHSSIGNHMQTVPRVGVFDDILHFGIFCQTGVREKLDVGFSFDQSFFVGSRVKYQVLGNQNSFFATSIGLDSGFNLGVSLFGNFLYYASVPVYISYHPTSKLFIYLTPRYLYVSEYIYSPIKGRQLGKGNEERFMFPTYGISFGNKHRFAIELSNSNENYRLSPARRHVHKIGR